MEEKYNVDFGEFLYYDENSPGGLRWKVNISKRMRAGAVAGYCSTRSGYWCVALKGKLYRSHRVVMVLNGTKCYDLLVDHIDRNKSNNRVENLRLVDNNLSGRNKSKHKRNSTGVTGVSKDVVTNRDGKIYEYFVSQWQDLMGNKHRKRFSINKLGYDVSFRLAGEYREEMIKELNAQGAGYTNGHGT